MADPLFVHLLPDTDAAGAEHQALYLMRGMRSRRLSQELVHFGVGPGQALFEGVGIPLRHVPRRRPLTVDLARSREFARLYAQRRPALVHAWLYEGNVVGLRAKPALSGSKPIVTQRSGPNEHASKPKLALLRRLL